MKIAVGDPLSPDGRALIEGSEQVLRQFYSADESYAYSPEELASENVTFYIAHASDGSPVGCVAGCNMGDYTEVKRLFVRDGAQGSGLGRALMEQVEAQAQAAGHRVIRLETGDELVAACALYRKMGYVLRGAFGDYPPCAPSSTFMEKRI